MRVIDYFEGVGLGIPDCIKALKAGDRADYNYREHNWPHDGNSRDFSTGKERSVIARGLGLKNLTVHPKYDVADSIDAGRRIISRCWFDATKTTLYLATDKYSARGFESLKNYQKKWDAKNKIYLDTPLHNWASHGADGWRLMAMALKPAENMRENRRGLPQKSNNAYDMFGKRRR